MRGAIAVLLSVVCAACGRSAAEPVCGGLDFSGAASVHGIVTWAGAPVAAALVVIGSSSAVTSSDGSFSIRNAAAGPQSLSLAPVKAGALAGDLSVLAGDNLLRIPVVREDGEGVLAGRTLDGCTGRPLPGVSLALVGRQSTTSDADGLYAIDGLCCGPLGTLRATRSGYRAFTIRPGRVRHTTRWIDVVMVRAPG